MSWLLSGAHNSARYYLNYNIDCAFANLPLSPCSGLNALAYGFPCNNYNLNQVTPTGTFYGHLILTKNIF